MSKIILNFKGLMAPVFTSFDDNQEKSIRLSHIDAYGKFLKSSGINGVLVNGSTGEGPALNVAERKDVTEAWSRTCKTYKLILMVQVGGAALCDVIDLTNHAQSLNVDAVLCLPELYFKPKTVEDLVVYLKKVAKHCASTPFLYYHIPMFTGLMFNMAKFCDIMENEVSNFVGIKYTSGDLDQGMACLKDGRNVFLGADTILVGAFALGFNSAITTTLNICPELLLKIIKYIECGKTDEARKTQEKLNVYIQNILEAGGGDWVCSMKLEFNKLMPNGVSAGPSRI